MKQCLFLSLLAVMAKAYDKDREFYQGPEYKEHNNQSAKLIWLIGGIAVIFMIVATSVAKCLFARKQPMKIEAAPEAQ